MTYMRSALILTLTGLPLTGASAASVTTATGHVTVRAQPGGRVLLSLPAQANQKVLAEQQGQSILVTLVQQQPARLTLIALNSSGQRFWKQAFAANFNKVSTHSGQFFVEYVTSGAQLNVHTLIWDGRSRTTDEIAGRLIAKSPTALLFNVENDLNPYDSVHLEFTRYTPKAANRTRLTFEVPARPQCGEVELDPDEEVTNKLTGRYVYALRRDACGAFVARFDWSGADATALVYPRAHQ